MSPNTSTPESWDPLVQGKDEPELLVAAQKREIANILRSYTGYNDLFSELLQNSLDAIERRMEEEGEGFTGQLWITLNLDDSSISLTDNGIGMTLSQFKQFLKPNFSFKEGASTRGSKGVGATYLGYGFNYLEVATKRNGTVNSAVLSNGRDWVDDTTGTISRPMMVYAPPSHAAFGGLDRGTSTVLRLIGKNIRPKNLSYYNATTADQWMAILRAFTPVGGVYLCGESAPKIKISLEVLANGIVSSASLDQPNYLWPHEVLGKTADLREFLADQQSRAKKQQDISKIPPRFTNLNGYWGVWLGTEILEGESIVSPRLTQHERELLQQLNVKLYCFMGFSTELWDQYNDEKLKLRMGFRILRGGLQQATKHMPQGAPITIPLTQNIGYQNITHVVVHFDNAEPDLGRKGFQPENTKLAERLAQSSVTPDLCTAFEALKRC
jgi:hypothetical protein